MPRQSLIQFRAGTAAQWVTANPVLSLGETGYESDTGFIKIGDGSTAWTSLQYLPVNTITVQVKAGEAINKGQAVYGSSANGTNIIVSKASNAAEVTSSKTLGLLTSSLALNGVGSVLTQGLLSGIDTSAATAGDPVWLGTSGNLIYGIANKPVAPAHLVFIGMVTRSHATNGEIFVRVQNGFELDELHDVLIASKADKDVLSYEASTGLWKNKTIADAGIAPSVHTHTKTQITGTAVTLADTGTVTNAMLANSSITVNGTAVSLGGSVTVQGESFHPFLLMGA